MKLSIALVLGLMMLGEGIVLGVMIALLIAFAVWLAQPLEQHHSNTLPF